MKKELKKYLGIDYGTKRVGFAMADAETKTAIPSMVYETDDEIIKKIIEICTNENIDKIIVGMPLNFKMQYTDQSRLTDKFINELKGAVSCEVETENEIFTSKISERSNVKHKDSSSAALILQGWLDKKLK